MKVDSVNVKKIFGTSNKSVKKHQNDNIHFRGNDSILLSQICINNRNNLVDFDKAKSYNMKKFSEFAIGAGLILIGALIAFKSKSVKKAATAVEDGLSNMGEYRESLARGLSEYTGKKVNAKNLSCVVNKEEFTDIISGLKRENYICTPENMEKGIFRADLHSHSNFSDGKGDVSQLLDEAAKYGDSLFEKTKNKFVFALTDHDGVEGVKKALEIISENPDKFKNIKFVPGAELSYVLKSPKAMTPTKTSEILAYCVNPFDKKTASYFDNLYGKRRNTIKESIDRMNQICPQANYSAEEFGKIYEADLNHDMYQMHLYWKIYHYGQTKCAISKIAQQNGQNIDALYTDIMSKAKTGKALGSLQYEKLVPYGIIENADIVALKKNIEPKVFGDNTIVARTENTIDELTSVFAEDKDAVFALAHPYYFTERVNNPAEFVKTVKDKFNGKLIGTESYHQAYQDYVSAGDVEKLNSELENMGLKALGGRDNHKAGLFE